MPSLELKPTHKPVQSYYAALRMFDDLGVSTAAEIEKVIDALASQSFSRAEFFQRMRHPILHVSAVAHPDSVFVESVTSKDLLRLFKPVVAFLPQLLNDKMVQSLHKLDAPRDAWVSARVPVKRRDHFCTIANELTLASLKYEFDAGRRTTRCLIANWKGSSARCG